MISTTAYAGIHRSIDNTSDAYIYAISKRIMRMNSVDRLEFTKTARQDHQDFFIINIKFHGPGRDKLFAQNQGYVVIDEIEYPISKYISPVPVPGQKRVKGLCEANYIVPQEVQDKIAAFTNGCYFKFGLQNKDIVAYKLSQKEQEELRLIANLRFEDYEKLESGEIKPREISENK